MYEFRQTLPLHEAVHFQRRESLSLLHDTSCAHIHHFLSVAYLQPGESYIICHENFNKEQERIKTEMHCSSVEKLSCANRRERSVDTFSGQFKYVMLFYLDYKQLLLLSIFSYFLCPRLFFLIHLHLQARAHPLTHALVYNTCMNISTHTHI